MKKEIRVIVKEPGHKSTVKEMVVDLKSLQGIVEGMIEIVPLPNLDGVDMVLNEEGKLLGLAPNVFLPEYDDLVVGNIVVCGFDEETGGHRSLTDDEVKKAQAFLEKNDADGFTGDVLDFIRVEYFSID
jgi:hypothetical protein